MSWLVPSLPSWSRGAAPAQVEKTTANNDIEEDDIDAPPPFPMLNSHQRSQAPAPEAPKPPIPPTIAPIPTLSFAIAPPSPTKSTHDDDEPPSDLNIAIIPDNIPIGNMAPPPSTVKKPSFGIQNGGHDGGGLKVAEKPKPKEKKKGKVALAPGHSPLDWARLTSSGQNLRGVNTFQRVTLAELKEHNTPDDAWSVFNGMVYNITPYLPFHPGGEDEMMRVAGRDGTRLFMLTHSWVNMDFMLKECMVGVLVK
ncbi:hypothetical protein B9479_000896 [Cryptococcus floricola]|uniref:Cytochrome b5 heme-binding domain-containing protein n=1 Tax=Cryptococcus floricola TaxID=2591691 RepID=A0A5D3B7Z7_9TREE|nr:hypothetical protein B9479_000896 [Cryptococcus floricola]